MRLSTSQLRRELGARNLVFAEGLPHESTTGTVPSVLYQDVGGAHGNFISASYRRICASPEWARRLNKCYSASRRLARSGDRVRRELDCATSSDALLMNVFCYPGVTTRKPVCAVLGIRHGLRPQFGVKPGIPLIDGRADRTEIDMALGDLLVEAKLTESGFQTARAELVTRYKDVDGVFDIAQLPRCSEGFRCYQLIRGVMAARHCGTSFLVIYDGGRLDLAEHCYLAARAVRMCELRSRFAILTWQELSSALPRRLQDFLEQKYGIQR